MSIDIFKVLDVATRVAKNSWEYGTVSEALLEWNHKDLSIWNIPFPNGQVPTLDVQSTDALNYIKDKINLTGDTLIGASGEFCFSPSCAPPPSRRDIDFTIKKR